jgi:hypothetical protein
MGSTGAAGDRRLGEIGSFQTTKQLVTTRTYDGLSLTTTRTAFSGPETRTETKNSLGKLQSVVDSLGNQIDYTYDPTGTWCPCARGLRTWW